VFEAQKRFFFLKFTCPSDPLCHVKNMRSFRPILVYLVSACRGLERSAVDE